MRPGDCRCGEQLGCAYSRQLWYSKRMREMEELLSCILYFLSLTFSFPRYFHVEGLHKWLVTSAKYRVGFQRGALLSTCFKNLRLPFLFSIFLKTEKYFLLRPSFPTSFPESSYSSFDQCSVSDVFFLNITSPTADVLSMQLSQYHVHQNVSSRVEVNFNSCQ